MATRLAVDLSTVGGTHMCPPQPWREIDAHAGQGKLGKVREFELSGTVGERSGENIF